jgi:hypothetical protein
LLVDFIGLSIPSVPIPDVGEGAIEGFKQVETSRLSAPDISFRDAVTAHGNSSGDADDGKI